MEIQFAGPAGPGTSLAVWGHRNEPPRPSRQIAHSACAQVAAEPKRRWGQFSRPGCGERRKRVSSLAKASSLS